ncbi:XdhC family protein [Nissabacter sp. SGAir0207]|uniref:XdhC family protein n=1 Tax=Nissabacter sp. SGAir0207 TaxID=2126321 RepID=UPI0010CCD653|nr:XdhC family protein [Nissabacter sp. SGAir0207]QCR35695.1 XshC-Cox1 family protein [Nissabacter sp. SGAir0207]
MQSLDLSVARQAQAWIGHQPVWLCTVLATFGSSPRSPGALLAATADGRYSGSLSGGCVEEDFIARLRAGEFRQPSQVVRYGDGGLTPNRALPCGGVLDILIEYLPCNADSAHYLGQLATALAGHGALTKSLRLPGACHALTLSDQPPATGVARDGDLLTLHIAAAPRLIVAGLSPVALYCAGFAVALGFETVVCEPREEELENLAPQLPEGVLLERRFPAKFIEQGGCHAQTAVVALTHDPRLDDLTLMEAVQTEAFYIGAMGSMKNSRNRRERLQRIAGLTEQELARVHAPIGLDIGSKTPAEIALAVMADVVAHKNRHVGLGG